MSWLRRLVKSNAMWAKLHRADTFPYTFNPINSNYEELVRTKQCAKIASGKTYMPRYYSAGGIF